MPLTNRVIAALLETEGVAVVVVEALLTALTLLEATVTELGTIDVPVLVTWPVVRVEELLVVAGKVVVAFVSAELYCAHRARPMDWMTGSWVAGQAVIRQGATMAAMEA
jgi:hypothetical protein